MNTKLSRCLVLVPVPPCPVPPNPQYPILFVDDNKINQTIKLFYLSQVNFASIIHINDNDDLLCRRERFTQRAHNGVIVVVVLAE